MTTTLQVASFLSIRTVSPASHAIVATVATLGVFGRSRPSETEFRAAGVAVPFGHNPVCPINGLGDFPCRFIFEALAIIPFLLQIAAQCGLAVVVRFAERQAAGQAWLITPLRPTAW